MRTSGNGHLPNLSKFRSLPALSDAVSRQLERRGFPFDICWQVASIVVSDRDAEFSQWLEDAGKTYKALKKRGEFCLRLGD